MKLRSLPILLIIALGLNAAEHQETLPMGFVRGQPQPLHQLGYRQTQEVSQVSGYAKNLVYTEPSAYLLNPSLNPIYYSLALPADSIENYIASALNSGADETSETKFGRLSLAVGPDGNIYAHPKFKTRTLAKLRDTVDVFDTATQHYLINYVTAHVKSRVNSPVHPYIGFWGLDNEWEAAPNYSEKAKSLFLQWLQAAYQNDINQLNEAWGSNFRTFDGFVTQNLPAPADYASQPGAFLDWYEFQAEYFHHILASQAKAMHDADPLKRPVVHKATQITMEMPRIARYRLMNHGAFANAMRPYAGGLFGIDMYGSGDRQAYETSFIYNCIRPEDRAPGHGVMLCETNNHGGPAHQFQSTFWRLLANGLKNTMLFTPGYAGANPKSDWAHFAFIDHRNGHLKPKYHSAARFANTLRRSTEFWHEAVPATNLPRLAMLVPKRDTLLSEASMRSPGDGIFSYPRNHRWMVYRWLREQGYWVEAIPYEKLTPQYLSHYQGLVLVGAEHLSPAEAETVAQFVAKGGTLMADAMPAYYDQHHRTMNPFAKVLDIEITRQKDPRTLTHTINNQTLTSLTHYMLENAPANDPSAAPPVISRTFHKGRILYFPFELGTLQHPDKNVSIKAQHTGLEPTAGAENYQSYNNEFDIGQWLAGHLKSIKLHPAYAASFQGNNTAARILRVEQPQVDAKGNTAVIISNRAALKHEPLPEGRLTMILPNGPWERAYWAPAENDQLIPVELKQLQGPVHRFTLPAIESAGILYLFRDHNPIISIAPQSGADLETKTLMRSPGDSFTLGWNLISFGDTREGKFRLKLPTGWTHGKIEETAGSYSAKITAPSDTSLLSLDHLYPMLIEYVSSEGTLVSSAACQIQMQFPDKDTPLLLSDNDRYPESYPYMKKTRAKYRYLSSSHSSMDPIMKTNPAREGRSLQASFGSIAGERDSFNRGEYVKGFYARYHSKKVSVEYDLQSEHQIFRVNVVAGPEPVQISLLELQTSSDGENFGEAVVITPLPNTIEQIFHLPRTTARYVRITAHWPKEGGSLDEIEIWGR